MNRKVRKIGLLVLKFAVAAGLLALLVSRIEWETFRETVTGANPWLLVAVFVGFTIPNFLLAVRWYYLLRLLHIDISFWQSVRLTFLGMFFNFVIPGAVSGDLVKAWYVARRTPRKAAVLVSIFTDRAVGLLEFAILPAVVMAVLALTGRFDYEKLRWPLVMVPAVLLAVAVAMSVLLSRRLRRWLPLRKLLGRLPIRKHLQVAAEAGELYRRRLGALAGALGLTFLSQMILITAVMLAGWSLHLDQVPWYAYYLYVPLIYILAAIPISPGNLGWTENLYVWFLLGTGASETELTALALLARLAPMLCSTPGLLVALRGPHLPPTDEMQAELGEAAPAAEPDTLTD